MLGRVDDSSHYSVARRQNLSFKPARFWLCLENDSVDKCYDVLFGNPAMVYFLLYFTQTLGVNVFSVFSCIFTNGFVLVCVGFFICLVFLCFQITNQKPLRQVSFTDSSTLSNSRFSLLWLSNICEFFQNCSRFGDTTHSSPPKLFCFSQNLPTRSFQMAQYLVSTFSGFPWFWYFCREGITDANNLFSQILVLSTACLRTDIPAAFFFFFKGCKCESYGWKWNLYIRLGIDIFFFCTLYCLVGVSLLPQWNTATEDRCIYCLLCSHCRSVNGRDGSAGVQYCSFMIG